MKFLPVLEKGDTFRAADGSERVVWKVVTILIDTEGQQHHDAPTICDHEGSEVVAPWKSGVMNCPKCGVWFEDDEPELNEPQFIAFTSDAIRDFPCAAATDADLLASRDSIAEELMALRVGIERLIRDAKELLAPLSRKETDE